jgi:CYTH domain-containing protein
MGNEIERKFAVKELPLARYEIANSKYATTVAMPFLLGGAKYFAAKKIVQGYIELADGKMTLRVRKVEDKYVLTTKSGSGLVRDEQECFLTKEQFDVLWPLVGHNIVEKVRYDVPLTNGNVAELDVYEGYHAGKVTVEVEFGSVEEAEAFQKPDWFGLELTNDKKWSNRSMARQSAKYAELERLLDEGLASGVALEGSSVFARLRARLKL